MYFQLIGNKVNLWFTPAVPFEEDEKDQKIWFLDHSYLESMYGMFKKVNGMFACGSSSFLLFCGVPVCDATKDMWKASHNDSVDPSFNKGKHKLGEPQ